MKPVEGPNPRPLSEGGEKEVGDDAAHNDKSSDEVTARRYPSGQGVELSAQRCGVSLLHLRGLKHLSALRTVADGKDTGGAVTLNDGSALHDVVAGVGSVGVEVFLNGSLGGLWLSRKR